MISVGNTSRSTFCILLANQFHLRGLGLGIGRHAALLKDGSECYGSSPFQEANQQNCAAATSTTESVSQTSNYFKNSKNIDQSSQQHGDTNHYPHPDKSSKHGKYFNADFYTGNSVVSTHKRQLPSEINESKNLKNHNSKKKTSKSRQATVSHLLQYVKQGHIQQAEKELQQLEASDKFRVGKGILLSLLGMYVEAEQLPPALATLSRLHALHPHVAVSITTALSLATLMLHHGQTSDCIKLLAEEAAFISEAAESNASTMVDDDRLVESADSSIVSEKKGNHKSSARNTVFSDKMCHALLMVPAARGDVSATEEVLEALLCHHYTKPSRAILGPLVQARIACRDWDGALSTLQRLAQEHSCLPCRPELMKALARLKDTDRLQRVVELSAELLGRENALLDLAVCFLESDDTSKAIEVLQMESNISPGRLQYLCQYYIKHRNTRCLHHLLTVMHTCGSPQDVQLVCSHLLHIYDEKQEDDKSAELLRAEGLTRQELPPITGLQTPASQRGK